MWVKCIMGTTDATTGDKFRTHKLDFSPDTYEFLGSPTNPTQGCGSGLNLQILQHNTKADYDLDHNITLFYRSEFPTYGSKPNKYLWNGLEGKRKRAWRDPILLVADIGTESEEDTMLFHDVVPSDIQIAKDYLDHYGEYAGECSNDLFNRMLGVAYFQDKLRGVRAHCYSREWSR
jgi:hypothetical protein